MLLAKSVVEGGVKEYGGGVTVESHVLLEILKYLNYGDTPIILHIIFPSTHVNDIWSLGCIIYHRLFGSPLCNFDCQQINSLILFLYTIDYISLQCLCFYFNISYASLKLREYKKIRIKETK